MRIVKRLAVLALVVVPALAVAAVGGLASVTGPARRVHLIITTAQSGDRLDRHHDARIGERAGGQTEPRPFTPDAVAAATAATLSQTP